MNKDKKIAETPLMKQYFSIKAKHPEAILLFRVGDFYETFGEDAILMSKILGIVLTKRANGQNKFIELAGFPHHSIDNYLPKIVRAGHKVAVCDQLEDPKFTKTIVKRGVTELVTPGVALNEQLLEYNENNYLASVCFEKEKAGVAFLDISTGTFKVASGSIEYIELLLASFAPKEILLQKEYRKGFEERFGKDIYISTIDEWAFSPEATRAKLLEQLKTVSLKGFGIEGLPLAITAAGAILFYLELTRHDSIGHVCSLSRIDETEYVWIDRFSFRNLEIFDNSNNGNMSLRKAIDKTVSPMGGRLLKNWLSMPIKSISELSYRHNIVEYFLNQSDEREDLQQLLRNLGDLERIISKAAAGKLSPKEAITLLAGLRQIPVIKEKYITSKQAELAEISGSLHDCDQLTKLLEVSLLPDPANNIGKGDVIASGVDQELDTLRSIVRQGKGLLDKIIARESEKTGISSLKISYNNIFGYYLEVRNTHKDKVPNEWIRKQTLVNAERYITPELKEYEEKIFGAEDKILAIEQRIFTELVEEIRKHISEIQSNSTILSKLDCLIGFAELAQQRGYNRPHLTNSNKLDIKGGRHPVIEILLPAGEKYIPNDIYLDPDSQQIIILTGPNMSGKSALLRQTALIVLLAQIGSFVPAESAEIGIVDKIFTRVGASDNITRGESTFMVEMLETATILHNISDKSLILLDEIGRGTSTYDGMSIAWAIVEYIHELPYSKAKTLFATHYHELNDLEKKFARVKNYHISIKEIGKTVLFLRKLTPGGVAHSFGIHVARMAGMPSGVVKIAERVLKRLENGNSVTSPANTKEEPIQLSFFKLDDPLLESLRDELKEIDITTMSPLDAFDKLRALKKKIGV